MCHLSLGLQQLLLLVALAVCLAVAVRTALEITEQWEISLAA